jgi:hypothetical protein
MAKMAYGTLEPAFKPLHVGKAKGARQRMYAAVAAITAVSALAMVSWSGSGFGGSSKDSDSLLSIGAKQTSLQLQITNENQFTKIMAAAEGKMCLNACVKIEGVACCLSSDLGKNACCSSKIHTSLNARPGVSLLETVYFFNFSHPCNFSHPSWMYAYTSHAIERRIIHTCICMHTCVYMHIHACRKTYRSLA